MDGPGRRAAQAMDGELREALEHARGQSEYIFAVVADIRGFSEFSRGHDSREVATYIKRVYIQLIDKYFPFAKFYKATGDGLLIAIPFEDDSLKETAQRTVDACVKCVSEFADICKSDPMVHFSVPDKIGFGIAWGPACCLASADSSVLDYSGHLLNLASRLMDLARPAGVVLDGAFGIGLLDEDSRNLFSEEEVYVRSVAETEPTKVYVLKDVVEIPEQAKQPIRVEHWETVTRSHTVRDWRKFDVKSYTVELPRRLKRSDGMIVELRHRPRLRGTTLEGATLSRRLVASQYVYTFVGNQPLVIVQMDTVLRYALAGKLTPNQRLEVWVNYVPE